MRALLDTNIVLDVFLARMPWQADAQAVLQAHQDGRLACALTTRSLPNMFYVGRKKVGAARALADVQQCLSIFEILDVTRQTLQEAARLPGSDFEDNIQIAAAVAAGVDAIVTRDPSGYVASPVPVFTPADLIARLPPPPP
jgi:predicted nucleic acid-binding protein